MSAFEKLTKMKEEKAAANLQAGEDFLKENKERPGVITTDSGLQYEIISEKGGSQKPKATDTVTCHYHGTLINGTVFDSSKQRGQPASFPLNRVISGWTEGLQYMSVGDTYKFFLHPSLAYGDRSAGAHIQPHSTLVFEVELISID
jgi:FKBP-type peptidyl-prolyl cis-trans isomerase FklB